MLYNPTTPDVVFASAFDLKYGKGTGKSLLQAYQLASSVPLRLASFHRSTWDYTLYSEGFIEAEPSDSKGVFDRSSPFISIDEFIYHETLDPQLLSIPAYVKNVLQSKTGTQTSPLTLADSSEKEGRKVLQLVADLRKKVTKQTGSLTSELDDAATWAYLGLYFAEKLRAGVALELYRKTGEESQKKKAVETLKTALFHWDNVVALTKNRYLPTPHVATQNYKENFTTFSWELLRPQVVRDIELAEKAVFKK